jgi:hypothetical protein
MKKLALFAFNGDSLCFVHVLLNAVDLREKGMKSRSSWKDQPQG